MSRKPEQQARAEIDRLLDAADWAVQDFKSVNLNAAQGVALREFPLKPGHAFANYLLVSNDDFGSTDRFARLNVCHRIARVAMKLVMEP